MRQQINERQRGSVIIITLLVIMLLIVLGAAGIRAAVFEENIVSNTQYHTEAFQASESAIEGTVSDDSALADALSAGVDDPLPTRSYTLSDANHHYAVTALATVGSQGITNAVGYSLTHYLGYSFTVRAKGEVAASNTVSNHVQHVMKIGPRGH